VATERKPLSSRVDLKEIVDQAAVANILVVEDDLDFGEAVCEILTISGYLASHAADGIAALQMLRAGELPDLILLDLMMPRMDGWEFREALLRNKRLKDIPVIVFSAVTEIAKPIKADRFLRKPVAPEVLLSAIPPLLRRRSES
jgi:two-component system, chemotaxis family, chemotaxis protein CheY